MSSVESVFIRKILEKVERRDFKIHTVSLDDMRFMVFILPLREEAEGGRDQSGFDRPWKAVYLDGLRQGFTIEGAAKVAGVTRRHVYRCRGSDEAFRREWDAVRSKG